MTAFTEIWTDTVFRTHARLPEEEIVRVTLVDGTVVWVSSVLLEILLPDNTYDVTIFGTTEDNQSVSQRYLADEDYPTEILPLIPEIIGAAFSALEKAG